MRLWILRKKVQQNATFFYILLVIFLSVSTYFRLKYRKMSFRKLQDNLLELLREPW